MRNAPDPLMPQFLGLVLNGKVVNMSPTDTEDGRAVFRLRGRWGLVTLLRFQRAGGVVAGEAPIDPIRLEGIDYTITVKPRELWGQLMRKAGTPLFCAVCLRETDEVIAAPLGRNDRMVNACGPCVGEHPRSGRYSFGERSKRTPGLRSSGSSRTRG